MNQNQVQAGQRFRQNPRNDLPHRQQGVARNQPQAQGHGGWHPAQFGNEPGQAAQQGPQAQFAPLRNVRREENRQHHPAQPLQHRGAVQGPYLGGGNIQVQPNEHYNVEQANNAFNANRNNIQRGGNEGHVWGNQNNTQ